MKERTMIFKSSSPRKRRTALACAAALAGVTAVVGVGAAPVAARPDYGPVDLQRPVAPARPTCGTSDTVAQPQAKGPSKAPSTGDVHVDRGLMLR
jgi:hypothetical protein